MGSDCFSSWSLHTVLLLLSESLLLYSVAAPKRLPAHPFNDPILPILNGCLQSFSIIPVPSCNSISKFITEHSKAVVPLWFSVFGDVSPYVCSYYF